MTTEEKKTILVIDDDETMRDMIEIMLMRGGYAPVLASSGEQALKIASESQAMLRLILVDRRMPDMDGPSVIEKLKLMPSLLSVPIIMLTGDSVDNEQEAAEKLGICLYLKKPFTKSELLDAITKHC